MFEQLMSLVRESSQEAIVQNPEIPNDQNEVVMQEAAGSVQTGIQQIYQEQGATGVKQLFESAQQGQTNSPQMQHVSNNFADGIINKLGISKGMAGAIAASVIPMILGKMMHKGNTGAGGSGGGFDMGSILGSILGGAKGNSNTPTQQGGGGGMLGNLSRMGASLGLDKDGDGDVDMQDLMGMFGKR